MSDNETRLLPCPFCGSDDLHVAGELFGDRVVMCGQCGVEGPADDFEEEEKAIAAWNRRVDTGDTHG